jgi:hypothetical protein
LTSIRLAERGTWLGDRLWVREVRKLTESGHQTTVLSTDYKSSAARLGPAMFARWSQENFFRYNRQSFNLDGRVDYGADIVPDATMVVNAGYRTLDGQARKRIGVLNRKIAEYGAVNLEGLSCFGACWQPTGRAAWVGCTASANSTASLSPKEFNTRDESLLLAFVELGRNDIRLVIFEAQPKQQCDQSRTAFVNRAEFPLDRCARIASGDSRRANLNDRR